MKGNRDATLTPGGEIRRGRQRVDTMEIKDEACEQVGDLLGLLAGARRFEMRLADTGETIKGTVAAGVTAAYRSLLTTPEQTRAGRRWRVRMRTREIREGDQGSRKVYTLLELLERIS